MKFIKDNLSLGFCKNHSNSKSQLLQLIFLFSYHYNTLLFKHVTDLILKDIRKLHQFDDATRAEVSSGLLNNCVYMTDGI